MKSAMFKSNQSLTKAHPKDLAGKKSKDFERNTASLCNLEEDFTKISAWKSNSNQRNQETTQFLAKTSLLKGG
jgi:hypothetical protein